MSGRVYPTLSEVERNHPEVSLELKRLAEFLDEHLPSTWEIFIYPFLNSEEPDITILNKQIGTAIFQVFDDTADKYEVKYKRVRSEKKGFYNKKIFYKRNGRSKELIHYPGDDLSFLRENLINIYVPDIGHSARRNNAVNKVVKKILYAPKLTKDDAKRLFYEEGQEDYYSVITREEIASDKFQEFYDSFLKSQTVPLERSWYDELRFWYHPPIHKAEEGIQLKFVDNQSNYAFHKPEVHQRFTGVAGCGKSLILAHRAAHIASKNKKVLFLTYNITLINYLQHLLRKAPFNFSHRNVVITNYHHFCSIYFRENDLNWPKRNSDERTHLDEEVPASIENMIFREINAGNRKYDAIIVDEVQDFKVAWLDSVRNLLTENNEIVIAGDDNQDIYGRGTKDLVKFKRGFTGPWAQIKFCYRLPPKIAEEVNRFAKIHLGQEKNIRTVRKTSELFDPTLIWYDFFDHDINRVIEIFNKYKNTGLIKESNTVILVPDNKLGLRISNLFERNNIQVLEIFIERNKKVSFKIDNPKLKICTVHSFKGWEYDNVIVYSPNEKYGNIENLDKLIYSSITRSIKNLIVINRHEKYSEFGNSPNWEYRTSFLS